MSGRDSERGESPFIDFTNRSSMAAALFLSFG